MVLALLKKRRSRIGTAAFGNNSSSSRKSSGRSSSTTTTTTTSSDDSDAATSHSTTTLWESLAQKGKWEAFVKAVTATDDWMVTTTSTTTTSSTTATSGTATTTNHNDEEIEVHHHHQDASIHSLHSHASFCPLHLALTYGAPLKIVEALLALLVRKYGVLVPEELPDEQGQTPLHVAVAANCPEDVVQRLLEGNNLVMPAVWRDVQDRTPLHVACGTPVSNKGRKKKSFLAPNQVAMDTWHKRRAVTILLQHYPEAVLLADVHGKTPLDYAKELAFSNMTIQELELAASVHATTTTPTAAKLMTAPFSQVVPHAKRPSLSSVSSLGMNGVDEEASLLDVDA